MDIHAWINSTGLLASLAVTVIIAIRTNIAKHEREIAEMHVKVETMWSFLLRRAAAEGVSAGMLQMNSPVRLSGNSGDMFTHIAEELRAFYRADGIKLGEKDLALAIERMFGARLVKEVCIPNNISLGVCLLIATAVARGSETLSEILDESGIPR